MVRFVLRAVVKFFVRFKLSENREIYGKICDGLFTVVSTVVGTSQ